MMCECVGLVVCNDGMFAVDNCRPIPGVNKLNKISRCSVCLATEITEIPVRSGMRAFPYQAKRQSLDVNYIQFTILHFLAMLNF